MDKNISGHIYQTTFTQGNYNFIGHMPSESPIGGPYMGIDTPSEEFYNINTNQSCPLMSARQTPTQITKNKSKYKT